MPIVSLVVVVVADILIVSIFLLLQPLALLPALVLFVCKFSVVVLFFG